MRPSPLPSAVAAPPPSSASLRICCLACLTNSSSMPILPSSSGVLSLSPSPAVSERDACVGLLLPRLPPPPAPPPPAAAAAPPPPPLGPPSRWPCSAPRFLANSCSAANAMKRSRFQMAIPTSPSTSSPAVTDACLVSTAAPTEIWPLAIAMNTSGVQLSSHRWSTSPLESLASPPHGSRCRPPIRSSIGRLFDPSSPQAAPLSPLLSPHSPPPAPSASPRSPSPPTSSPSPPPLVSGRVRWTVRRRPPPCASSDAGTAAARVNSATRSSRRRSSFSAASLALSAALSCASFSASPSAGGAILILVSRSRSSSVSEVRSTRLPEGVR